MQKRLPMRLSKLAGVTVTPRYSDTKNDRSVTGYNTTKVNSALHPFGVAKSSTSFGWGKGRKVTSAG